VVRASAATALIGTNFAAEPFVVNSIRSVVSRKTTKTKGALPAQCSTMIGLIEFLSLRSANQILTSLLSESHGAVDPAILAAALLKSPGSLAGKDVSDEIRAHVMQFRTGLYLSF
jgi:hypothetical protein